MDVSDKFAARTPGETRSMTAPLRICLLGYRSDPCSGGQGIYLYYLSKALVDLGHHVDVISGQPYPTLDPRVTLIEMPGLNLYERGLGAVSLRDFRSLTNMIEWCSKATGGFAEPQTFGRRVSAYLKAHRHAYDIIHDNQSVSYAMLSLQRLGFPLITTIHHPCSSDRRMALAACRDWGQRLLVRRWYRFVSMQRSVARQLRHIVTVSQSAREAIEREFSLDAGRVEVVLNGIDTEVFQPDPVIVRDPNLIMSVCSSDQPLKGMGVLLRCFAILANAHPSLTLLMVGRPKPGGEADRLLDSLGIRERVICRSGLSPTEMARAYCSAALVLVPSLYEGFGLPAGEAMACATAVVSSDGGALPEVVGDAGVLVPAGDPEALAAAASRLLAEPERAEQLGRAALARIRSEFSWHTVAMKMAERYQAVRADCAHASS